MLFKKYIREDFVCKFNFKHYPFDTQTCNLEFAISHEDRESIQLVNASEFPAFWGSTEVNQYTLSNFKYLKQVENHKLVIQFIMKRELINVFLTDLMPAILINLVILYCFSISKICI